MAKMWMTELNTAKLMICFFLDIWYSLASASRTLHINNSPHKLILQCKRTTTSFQRSFLLLFLRVFPSLWNLWIGYLCGPLYLFTSGHPSAECVSYTVRTLTLRPLAMLQLLSPVTWLCYVFAWFQEKQTFEHLHSQKSVHTAFKGIYHCIYDWKVLPCWSLYCLICECLTLLCMIL